MVRRVAETEVAAGLDPVVVVVGHQADGVRQALDGIPLQFATNDRPDAGMSASLRAGIEAVESAAPNARGASVLLGDMPWVRPVDLESLVATFLGAGDDRICVPVFEGRRGNPVLWGASYFTELKRLGGDVGGRVVLERHARSVLEVPVDDGGVLRDVDTPEAWSDATGL
jgi:molybdenum cofactor cytidylyltransferase